MPKNKPTKPAKPARRPSTIKIDNDEFTITAEFHKSARIGETIAEAIQMVAQRFNVQGPAAVGVENDFDVAKRLIEQSESAGVLQAIIGIATSRLESLSNRHAANPAS